MRKSPGVLVLSTTAWLACSSPAAAIPPPPEQYAARCDSPTYASDLAVCADPELLEMDQQVLRLYESWSASAGFGAGGTTLGRNALVETQDAWFRRRSLCAFSAQQAGCLRAAYQERLEVLGAASLYTVVPEEVLHGLCRNAPWGAVAVRVAATQAGELMLFDETGRILAIAVAEAPRDDWTPFLRHEAEGSQLRLFPLEGPVVTCELRQPN